VTPDTPAISAVVAADLDHRVVVTDRAYSVEEAAEKQGVAVPNLLKTLVARRSDDDYLFILVPGDRVIDWPSLRSHLGVNRMTMPDADEAFVATGYVRGTITPFGSQRAWPVIADSSIVEMGVVSFGAGAHGVSLHLDAKAALEFLGADLVPITKSKGA